MATLADIISEIFAPHPNVGAPTGLGGPESEPKRKSPPTSRGSQQHGTSPDSARSR